MVDLSRLNKTGSPVVIEGMDEEQELTRTDFANWFEWIDYISFAKCAKCSSGRFYVLLGAITLGLINLAQFGVIVALLL